MRRHKATGQRPGEQAHTALTSRRLLGVSLLALLVGCGRAVPPTVRSGASSPLAPSPAVSSPANVQTATQSSAPGTPIADDVLSGLPPVVPSPAQPTPTCSVDGGITLAIDQVSYPGLSGQAWAAEQIVVGVVLAQGTRWESVRGDPSLFTYSLVRVEQRVRGVSEGELLVRSYGGTLKGCTQRSTLPTLVPGQTALLFLQRSSVIIGARWPVYNVVGGEPGLRRIERDGQGQAWVVSGGPRLPLQQVLDELQQALRQSPPSALPTRDLIPLTQAPLAPMPTATPP